MIYGYTQRERNIDLDVLMQNKEQTTQRPQLCKSQTALCILVDTTQMNHKLGMFFVLERRQLLTSTTQPIQSER